MILKKNLRVVKREARKECLEETGIDISAYPLIISDAFIYSPSEEAGIAESDRLVFMIHVRLKGPRPEVVVNQTLGADGKPDDKHDGAEWVTRKQLEGKRDDLLLIPNSREFVRTLGFQ